ncbi:MAG TPA: hypothetical protein VHE12_10890 [bacterium]|nr:hypothetical protein [bacterium]
MKNSVPAYIFSIVLLFLAPSVSKAGYFSLGEKSCVWTTNFTDKTNGNEFYFPIAFDINLNPDFSFYGFSQFGIGNYFSTQSDPNTIHVSNLSDSILGTELRFNNFSLPALLNIGVNFPTGNTSWETEEITANVPVIFMDSRYHGRGLGVNVMYGLTFPSGNTELGVACGYSYSGAFNTGTIGSASGDDVKFGDSYFVSLSHVMTFEKNKRQYLRLSAYSFLPTQLNEQDSYQPGLNLNGSYSWVNPTGLSIDVGAQYFFASKRLDLSAGKLAQESNAYYAPKLYLIPTVPVGDLELVGDFKYILPNDYPLSDVLHEGGGILAGFEPELKFGLDGTSDLKVNAGYDFILHRDVPANESGTTFTDAYYNMFTFGATYEVKL